MKTREALRRLTGGKINANDVSPDGPLARNADWLIASHDKRVARIEQEKQRHELVAAVPALEAARKKVDKLMASRVLPDDFPIVTRFDAFSVVKSASRDLPSDTGIKHMATHLERLWHKDPLGSLSAGIISKLRDHYQYQNPRSKVGMLVDEAIPKVSFSTLPTSNLTRIAANINCQADFDEAIALNGLQGDDIQSVRARTFIHELVTRKAGIEGAGVTASDKCAKHGEADCTACMTKLGVAKSRASFMSRVASKINDMKKTAQRKTAADPLNLRGPVDPMEESMGQLESAEPMESGPGSGPMVLPEAPDTLLDVPQEGNESSKSTLHRGMEIPALDADPKIDRGTDNGSDTMAVADIEAEEEGKKQQDGMGIGGTGMMQVAKREQAMMQRWAKANNVDLSLDKVAKAPPGWEGAVLEMKKDKDIDNPWALSWWMKGKGYKARKPEPKTSKKAQKEFEPTVNDQQDPELKLKQSGGADVLTGDKELKQNVTSPAKVEAALLKSGSFVAPIGYTISIDDDDMVCVSSGKSVKKYALVDMDSAIGDFVYLTKTAKQTPPPPVFYFREGINVACPNCAELNSYVTPKTAANLACSACRVEVPAHMVTEAFNNGTAYEESALVAIVPNSTQVKFGEVFAKAASMLGTHDMGVDGCRVEAYAKDASDEQKGETWDFLIESGFTPIAQMAPPVAPPAPAPGAEMASDTFMPGARGVPPEMPLAGDEEWADESTIRAAMTHYKNTGLDAVGAIVQFKKDYGSSKKTDGEVSGPHSFDPNLVVAIAAEVWGADAAQLGEAMSMPAMASVRRAELPTPSKVNTQQPDAVKAEDLGEDSDTKGEIPNPGSIKSQHDPQGNFAETSTEPDTDDRDPGDFGAASPVVQHPATDQSGTSLSDTDLGEDSDTGDNQVTREMGQRSRQAPNVMRSGAPVTKVESDEDILSIL